MSIDLWLVYLVIMTAQTSTLICLHKLYFLFILILIHFNNCGTVYNNFISLLCIT